MCLSESKEMDINMKKRVLGSSGLMVTPVGLDNVVLPKTEYKKRDIWDAETIRLALDQRTDSKL